MRTHSLLLAALMTVPSVALAQTAPDAFSLSRDELHGTARFMSMGGAFTALGGDLSTLTQNPGGIGIYRSSEVGVTMNIDVHNVKSESQGSVMTDQKTKVTCPNFGYVGTWQTGNKILPFFNWGVTYGRAANFDRIYQGNIPSLTGSLSNYVAGFTSSEGWTGEELNSSGSNPYGGYAPWLSALMYNGCVINPVNPLDPSSASYMGLNPDGTPASGSFAVTERGYVDEYSINFGGNFVNTVYWGIGVGIEDISLDQYSSYAENFTGGQMPYQSATGNVLTGTGDGGYVLNSAKHLWGTGYNVKFGLIVKPINELRIGFAVHTPTWYDIQQTGFATIDGSFQADGRKSLSQYTYTNDGVDDYFEWKLKTPWKLMFGLAGVIDNKAIVSLDYEYRPYQDMTAKTNSGGYEFPITKEDIKSYYQATSQLRLGVEYRVSPSFSLRAGYSYTTSPTKGSGEVGSLLADPATRMDTDGPDDRETIPSLVMEESTNLVSVGLGWRYQMFYIDGAYVYRHRSSTFYPWASSQATAKLSDRNSTIVLSAGLKF